MEYLPSSTGDNVYTEYVDACPACLSLNIQNNFLISKQGFMSAAGCAHSRCVDCRTVFLNPRPTDLALKNFYLSQKMESSIAVRSSAERVLQKDRKEYFYTNRVAPLQAFLDIAECTVFDVGCGVGAFVKMLRDLGCNATGCDISPVSIRAGREILELNENEIYEGDIFAVRPGEYDLITLWTVIEHLLEPESYINYLRDNFIKKNGYILLEYPTVDSAMFEYCPESFFWIMPPYHQTIFSAEGLRAMLTRCGFEIVHEKLMPKNWYFFDSISRKLNLEETHRDYIKKNIPELTLEIDSIFDDFAYRLGKPSARWVLARHKTS